MRVQQRRLHLLPTLKSNRKSVITRNLTTCLCSGTLLLSTLSIDRTHQDKRLTQHPRKRKLIHNDANGSVRRQSAHKKWNHGIDGSECRGEGIVPLNTWAFCRNFRYNVVSLLFQAVYTGDGW